MLSETRDLGIHEINLPGFGLPREVEKFLFRR